MSDVKSQLQILIEKIDDESIRSLDAGLQHLSLHEIKDLMLAYYNGENTNFLGSFPFKGAALITRRAP